MSRKLSGAQRRKLAREEEAAHEMLLSKTPKLTSFYSAAASSSSAVRPVQQPDTEINSTTLGISNTGTTTVSSDAIISKEQSCEAEKLPQNGSKKAEKKLDGITMSGSGDCTKISASNSKPLDSQFSAVVNSDPVTLLSNDPSTWSENLTKGQRDQLVLMGPMPLKKSNDEYPQNEQKRHFSNDFQYRRLNNGEKIRRRWLVYSTTADAVFCFCCRLFDPLSKSQFGQKSGNSGWKHIGERLCSHETSTDHFKYMQQWVEAESRLNGDSSINRELMDQVRTEAARWQAVLKRIIAIILYLAEHNIAFRGSSSTLNTKNNGNFLGLVQLLGQFDNVMMDHIRQVEKHENRVHMLGWSIQNELIGLLAQQVKQVIIEKIKCSKYFSVIMDCTPDISHREQASLTIRYVHEEEDNGNITIEESFIGYSIARESTGEALTNLLFREIAACGLDMNNCRGQGYDNGANMAGIHKGVQARILKKYPRANFIPCGCHSLNLVISDAARSSVKSTSLFGILQRLYTIFAGSVKRWCVISEHVKSLTVKQVCETRWEARMNSVKSVRYQYAEVRDALVQLGDSTDDPKITSEAQSLVKHMEEFPFIVCVIVWHDLLFEVNLVSKTLQGKTADISLARTQLKKCIDFVTAFREKGFNDSIITATEIAAELEIDPIFPSKRNRVKKRQFSYESRESSHTSPEEDFKRDVFYPLIDTLNVSLKERFSQLDKYHEHWSFLYSLKNLPERAQLIQCCEALQILLTSEGVSDINGKELFNELQHVSSIVDEENTTVTPIEVLKRIKNTNLKDLFPNLWIALRILLTIPVTVASGERSFSKLKLIKTYLRSTMSDERLTALAMLSIENDEARKLDFGEVIASFANAKARKIPL